MNYVINLYHVTTQRPCNIEPTQIFFSTVKFENYIRKILIFLILKLLDEMAFRRNGFRRNVLHP